MVLNSDGNESARGREWRKPGNQWSSDLLVLNGVVRGSYGNFRRRAAISVAPELPIKRPLEEVLHLGLRGTLGTRTYLYSLWSKLFEKE